MQLSSTAFEPGGEVPVYYTKDGKNVSPEVSWKAVFIVRRP